eukprot:scaffold19375_cov103-Isochrysis_galbana.AAC.6
MPVYGHFMMLGAKSTYAAVNVRMKQMGGLSASRLLAPRHGSHPVLQPQAAGADASVVLAHVKARDAAPALKWHRFRELKKKKN